MSLYDLLKGQWRFERSIRDFRNPVTAGLVNGTAEWVPSDKADLLYCEQGVMQYGAYEETVHQFYHYHFDVPDHARVRFQDGREFYQLCLHDGHSNLTHHCGDDLYEGDIAVTESGIINLKWLIRGPRKYQEIVTRFQKQL